MQPRIRIFTLYVLILTGSVSMLGAQLGGLGKKVKDVSDVAAAFTIDDETEIAMGREAHPFLVARMGGLTGNRALGPPTAKRIKQAESQISGLPRQGEDVNQPQYTTATAGLD